MVGDIVYISIRKYSPNFYQPNVGMSATDINNDLHITLNGITLFKCVPLDKDQVFLNSSVLERQN